MEHYYHIKTSIPRDFDPEVEGETLDSICETCNGYVRHTIPFQRMGGMTKINIALTRLLEEGYLRGQLNDNFREEQDVVLGIERE